ncbi:MAG: prolipoprotein diacylglyceryl transferase [Desulfobacteraceae bacterium]
MMNLSFLIFIFFFTALLMAWGFKQLPREQWQFFAAVPVVKQKDGTWKGMNLTYYGIFSANAYIFALAVLVILLGACSIPAVVQMKYIIPLLGAAVPAARIVAWMVEKKSSGFTVGGASFVAIILLPWVVAGVNLISSFQMPVFCFFAAVALAYSFGEGLGRLACISFGCCYGKSLANSSRWIKWIFSKYHFIFQGKTKKIAYASCLDNQPIIPVQAVTAVIYTVTGLIGTALFLYGHFKMSLGVTLVITQLWRVFSEFFRDDFRGGRAFSAYQIMALVGVAYMGAVILIMSGPVPEMSGVLTSGELQPSARIPDVITGVRILWQPGVVLFLQMVWVIIFLYTGRSSVTGSTLLFHVVKEKI